MSEPYVCPKCFREFAALFLYVKHLREMHGEKAGL